MATQSKVLSIVSGLSVFTVSVVVGINVFKRFVTAEPNEWLLVIKDGELKQSGVGISIFRGFNETVVKFPSLLNKVSFQAQQVSKEMQGVELTGFLLWVIHRDGNCPMKAYRHIKDLSNLRADSEVNLHLKSMAESIVRHQIANLGINEVITQRKKLRDGIVGEMQEILNGWGIWLETVEITEVKVLSNSLFNDLQQPYRSETREIAEQIKIESQFKIDHARNEKDVESRLHRQKQDQQLNQQREEIKRHNIDMTNKTLMLQIKSDMQLQKERQQMEADQLQHSIKMKQVENDWELKKITDSYEVDSKMSDVSMKKQILSTVENIYKNMRCDSMRIVNFGSNQSLEYGVGKMAMALKEIGNQLNMDDDK